MSDRHYENQIATTIRDQIGSRALYMMGAKNVMAGENGSLSWKVGRGARGKAGAVTHMRVELDHASDTYTVESIRCNTRAAIMVKTLEKTEGVYADMLHSIISGMTGMALSL